MNKMLENRLNDSIEFRKKIYDLIVDDLKDVYTLTVITKGSQSNIRKYLNEFVKYKVAEQRPTIYGQTKGYIAINRNSFDEYIADVYARKTKRTFDYNNDPAKELKQAIAEGRIKNVSIYNSREHQEKHNVRSPRKISAWQGYDSMANA